MGYGCKATTGRLDSLVDADLSSAGASFWDEDRGDVGGWSVASAVDLNGGGC